MSSTLPLISIITPSFNCAPYIRQCIESVLAQKVGNLEHIVIDGASEDGTDRVLKEYAHLKWISEPDRGEGDALNKALRMAQGDIVGWLNADDYYAAGALQRVATEMNPAEGRHVIYGNTQFVDEQDNFLHEEKSERKMTLALLLRWWEHRRLPHQPSIFYSRELVDDIGPFNQDLHFSIDYEYWLRIACKYSFHYVDQVFSIQRIRGGSKSLDTVPGQIRSHWKVSEPYRRRLSTRAKFELWKDYAVFYIGRRLWQVRDRIRLRTRLRQAAARILRIQRRTRLESERPGSPKQ